MLTLDEAWEKSYKQYLNDVENSIDDSLLEMLEANNEICEGFDILKEYYSMIPLDEEVVGPGAGNGQENPGAQRINAEADAEHNSNAQNNRANNAQEKPKDKDDRPFVATNFLFGMLPELEKNGVASIGKSPAYAPVPGVSEVERISDMRFPKNVVFFIQQLIQWIKRVVVYFIEKVKNIVRKMLGTPEVALDPEALKLKLERSRKAEQITTFPLNGNEKPQVVKAYRVDPSNIQQYLALKEEAGITEGWFADVKKDISKDPVKPDKKTPVVVTIDISKDLLNLKQLLQHFFDLYDNAFGSNNESLFKTDDLALILQAFEDMTYGLKTGKMSTYEVGSAVTEYSAIDSARIRDNLIRTNTNIENLKSAYTETAQKINSVVRIITHKEMLMLSGYGIDSTWLSSSTYRQMVEILQVLTPRMKDAKKDEKALEKMQTKYEKVSKELVGLQKAFMAYGNISYTTVYQRRVVDLCNSAKYMSQVVTLRLTAVALYIKEMKDMKQLFVTLAQMNDRS